MNLPKYFVIVDIYWALLKGTAGFVLVLFALAHLGRWWWIFDLLTNIWPQMVFILACCGVLLIAGGRYKEGGLYALLALYGSLWIWPYYLPAPATAVGEPAVTILVSNVYQHVDNIDQLRALIAERDPDVILLMEMIPDTYEAVQAIAQDYPYYLHEPRLTGNAVFSRLPPEHLDVRDWAGGRIDIELQLNIDGQSVLFLVTHARATRSGREASERDLQLADMARFVQRRDRPVVIAGDLNVTPWSSYYRDLLRNTDLYDNRYGRGLMPTWPVTNFPWSLGMMPLDYVLTTPEVQVHTFERTADIDSDHYPLWVALSVR